MNRDLEIHYHQINDNTLYLNSEIIDRSKKPGNFVRIPYEYQAKV